MTKINFLFIGIIIVFFHLNVHAQGVKIYQSDGNVMTINYAEIDSVVAFSENDVESKKWVDLGLPSGLKWATRNIGASSPEDYGDYFAWGESWSKDFFSKFYSNYGWEMGDISGDPQHDAAVALWGDGAHVPTETESRELIEHCAITPSMRNHVRGWLVTGPNGNSIFFPSSGHMIFDSFYCLEQAAYFWISQPGGDRQNFFAYILNFSDEGLNLDSIHRFYGCAIRPVRN